MYTCTAAAAHCRPTDPRPHLLTLKSRIHAMQCRTLTIDARRVGYNNFSRLTMITTKTNTMNELVQLGGPSYLPAKVTATTSTSTSTSRRPWTSVEDSALSEAVKKYGSDTGHGSSWGKISAAVGGGRTNKVYTSRLLCTSKRERLMSRIVGKDGFTPLTLHYEREDGLGKKMPPCV